MHLGIGTEVSLNMTAHFTQLACWVSAWKWPKFYKTLVQNYPKPHTLGLCEAQAWQHHPLSNPLRLWNGHLGQYTLDWANQWISSGVQQGSQSGKFALHTQSPRRKDKSSCWTSLLSLNRKMPDDGLVPACKMGKWGFGSSVTSVCLMNLMAPHTAAPRAHGGLWGQLFLLSMPISP